MGHPLIIRPGERVEVDYAGDPIEWVEFKTGEIRKAYVFVAGLLLNVGRR